MKPDEMSLAIADHASDRKALEIVELDLRGIVSYTDYFVICSGRSDRQTRAIHEGIYLGMKADGEVPSRVEGIAQGDWILMDYGDVVVHIFTPQTRDHYRLEQLWGEAPSRSLDAAQALEA